MHWPIKTTSIGQLNSNTDDVSFFCHTLSDVISCHICSLQTTVTSKLHYYAANTLSASFLPCKQCQMVWGWRGGQRGATKLYPNWEHDFAYASCCWSRDDLCSRLSWFWRVRSVSFASCAGSGTRPWPDVRSAVVCSWFPSASDAWCRNCSQTRSREPSSGSACTACASSACGSALKTEENMDVFCVMHCCRRVTSIVPWLTCQ